MVNSQLLDVPLYAARKRKSRVRRTENILTILCLAKREMSMMQLAWWLNMSSSSHLRSILDEMVERDLIDERYARRNTRCYQISAEGKQWRQWFEEGFYTAESMYLVEFGDNNYLPF